MPQGLKEYNSLYSIGTREERKTMRERLIIPSF